MPRIKNATFELFGQSIEVDFEESGEPLEVETWVPATFRKDPKLAEDGSQELDEAGNPVFIDVLDKPGYTQSVEEAVLDAAKVDLALSDFTPGGYEYAEVTVSFTITGSATVELGEYDLTDIDNEADLEYAVSSGDLDIVTEAIRQAAADDWASTIEIENVEVNSTE